MKFVIYLFAITAIIGCKSTKNTIKDNSSEATTEGTSVSDTIYRFNVSFYSIGEGIDTKAMEKLNEYIIQYEQKNNIKISYKTQDWGKEGEVDYYFKLDEVDEKKQDLFIAETKELLKSSELIRYNENIASPKKVK